MDNFSITDFFIVIFLVVLFYPLLCALIALIVSIFKKIANKNPFKTTFKETFGTFLLNCSIHLITYSSKTTPVVSMNGLLIK